MSEVKVNKISPRSGTDVTLGDASDTFTIPASATLDVNGTIDVTGATVTGLSLEDDIAILGFKVAANGSLAKYDLVDQTIDAFEDASGVDASASTNEVRNASNYYSGISTSTSSFTADGTYSNPAGVTSVEYLVVAGGGGGGYNGGGGGGAGGYRTGNLSVTESTSYGIVVGSGGSGGGDTNTPGSDGSDSSFSTITSTGGGGGGSRANSMSGRDGGSGGGASADSSTHGSGNTPSTTPSQGNDGGSGSGVPHGGGGSSTAGGIGGSRNAGAGTSNDISGSSVTYATGGTGGSTGTGSDATANTGDGAEGGGSGTGAGGAGGSGIVIITYDLPVDVTLVSNATTAEAEPTKGDLVLTYTNGAGTATVNTDIKGWVSRDDGTTYTQFTLADEGDTGGHTILTAHGLDISGQPSGTSMRYKITTHNQSASKTTRIQAVSLGWS